MKKTNIKRLKSQKENTALLALIEMLSRDKKPIWRKVIYELSRPRRQRVEVNLSKLEAYGPNGGTVVVPGKVLGSGGLSKKITVAAFSFSDTARKLIADAGGRAVTIESLYKNNPRGKDVVFLK